MATQAFRDWVAAGRPFHLATPIAEYRAALLAAGWGVFDVGTLGDEAHLTAETPEDHTPFSVTGYPQHSEYPYIHALDAMHHPERGLDVGPLVDYWLSEARAGRTPWVKYINWEGLQWDVRRSWVPRTVGGHFDHAHLSIRSDWTHQSIGGWTVVKKGTPVTTTQTGRDVWGHTIESPSLGQTMSAADWIKYCFSADQTGARVEVAVNGLSATVADLAHAVGTPVNPGELADALAASDTFIDRLATAIVAKTTADTLEVRVANARELLRALGQSA